MACTCPRTCRGFDLVFERAATGEHYATVAYLPVFLNLHLALWDGAFPAHYAVSAGVGSVLAQFHERKTRCHGALDLGLGVMGRVFFPVPGGSGTDGERAFAVLRAARL